jgi:uncharacterized Zn finger protein
MLEQAPDEPRHCPYCGSEKLHRETAGSLRHPSEVFIVVRCETCGKSSKEKVARA